MPQQRNTIGVPTINLRHNIKDLETRRALEQLSQETTRWLQRIAEGVDTATGLRGEPTYHAAVNAKDNRIMKLGVPKDDTDAQMKGLALGRAGFGSTYWDAKNLPIRNLPKDVAASQADATLTQEQIRAIIAEELRKLNDTLIAEPYVTVSASTLLTAERRLVAEATVLEAVDGGANSTLTLNVLANGISNAKLRDSGALSVIGRSANSTGDPADISATAATDAVLRESGSVLGFGTVATAGIADNAVTDVKLRDSAATSVIGRSAGSSGDPADIAASADGQVLRRSGGSVAFGAVDLADTDAVTGILVVGNGGTGVATFTSNGVLYGNAAGALQVTAQGGTNTVLTASAGAPVFSATPTVTTVNATTGYNQGGTQVVGAQGAAVADAAGGATIDAEARTALNTLLARLRTHGLIAT